jgi:hypothetical protein
MADGNWKWELDQAAPRRLCVGAPVRLWAVCRCGGETMLDPAPWVRQGLEGHPLHALEDRVRCRCGARRVRLEWRAFGGAGAGTPGPYAFR